MQHQGEFQDAKRLRTEAVEVVDVKNKLNVHVIEKIMELSGLPGAGTAASAMSTHSRDGCSSSAWATALINIGVRMHPKELGQKRTLKERDVVLRLLCRPVCRPMSMISPFEHDVRWGADLEAAQHLVKRIKKDVRKCFALRCTHPSARYSQRSPPFAPLCAFVCILQFHTYICFRTLHNA